MRIVIDLQGAQSSGSRNRGIGRYSLSLAQAIVRNRGEHEVFIALNGFFSDTIEPIRAQFDQWLPQENIRVWHAVGPVSHIDGANNWRRKVAEYTREAFLATLSPDILYVTSLFEGLIDNAVTSIGLLTKTVPTAVTLYDLIPLINRSPYLDNPVVELWYESKLDQIRRSGLLLAISESSRQEGINYLGFPEERSVNVGTAADPQFQQVDIGIATEQTVRERYGLLRPFVMYTGGIDHRKNIEGLIRSYALLPHSLRKKHQLAIVCSVQPETRRLLAALAAQHGLNAEDVILTGFVPEDDLIALYHLCKTFIFPSWHEGFGLPALEAMSCGAAVIAANTSSLPEVVGREDALFNPYDDKAIAKKIQQVLTDDAYREELSQHGLEQAQKFSWDESARLVIRAFEKFNADNIETHQSFLKSASRPKLAYVSPLPPERTGIADYSAELLPELARYYDIDVIVSLEVIANPWIKENCLVRTVEWFESHSDIYDRVIYHFGNSPYHQHMFGLLEKIPGIVVLHDFFLGHVATHLDGLEDKKFSGFLAKALYQSHGYKAVYERFQTENVWDLAWKYPCNKIVIDNAQAVIVHSDNSKRLAHDWYGQRAAEKWSVIPLLRIPVQKKDRTQARNELGIPLDAFVVSSFGLLGPSKQNQQLLDAWLQSPLRNDERCFLVFVGENDCGSYGAELMAAIHNNGISHRVKITGWADVLKFRQYLAATDVAVQLRTLSRGETSAAVLDCMNYGLATIVNANGSMADLPKDSVCMLRDEFQIADLSMALENLWRDGVYRDSLGQMAREVIHMYHAPRSCADQYFHVIEKYSRSSQIAKSHLANAISKIDPFLHSDQELIDVAKCIAQNKNVYGNNQLFLDVSVLVQCDAKSGIQRVVRSILWELLTNPPNGFRVEPVYAIPGQLGYNYARKFILGFLGSSDCLLDDEPLEAFPGDIFLGLDLAHYAIEQQAEFFVYLKQVGVEAYFVVYDLLPVLTPCVFPDGVSAAHQKWLTSLAQSDGVICISRAVADEMMEWLNVFGPKRLRPLKLGWFHLGADVAGSIPSTGLPSNIDEIAKALSCRPTFLMVGTIEPRKGQKQAIDAFDLLWANGIDVNLVIVGKMGWNMELFMEKLRNHPENSLRLFWLDGISDEYLEKIYAISSCLIAASEGEGFGLPLIEAAQHNLPIIARDIPVFREVLGEHGFYFDGGEPSTLSESLREWLVLHNAGQTPQSVNMPWLTWKESTKKLLDVMLGGQWYQQWMPDEVPRFWGGDSRLGTQVGKRMGRDIVSTGQAGYLIFGPYIPMAAGSYKVLIRGEIGGNGVAGAHMDVAVDQGRVILGESTLVNSAQDGCIIALPITLDKPCSDLEVRVWVNDASQLRISLVEVAPWQDEPTDLQQNTQAMSIAAAAIEHARDAVEFETEEALDELAESPVLVQSESVPKPSAVQVRPQSASGERNPAKTKRKKKR